MQTDFLSDLTIRQPRRRSDPLRARLERREAHRRKLLAAPEAQSLLPSLRTRYVADIAHLSDEKWAWIRRAHRAGLVERCTTGYPFNKGAWRTTSRM